MTWSFLTFGAGNVELQRAAKRLMKQANTSGYFSNSYAVTEKILKSEYKEFWKTNKKFIEENPLGFGLWKWKPYVIEKLLSSIEFGDGLLYLDAGCQFNFSNRESRDYFIKLIELAEKKSALFFQLNCSPENKYMFAEYKWTKPDVFKFIPIGEELKLSGQIQATSFFLVKSEKTENLVKDWVYFSNVDDSSLLINPKQEEELPSEFQAHRNDQSILSVLVKKHQCFVIPEETYWHPNWKTLGKHYPIWALRNKTGITRFEFKIFEIPDYFIRLLFILKLTTRNRIRKFI